jgi:hypothetical protein
MSATQLNNANQQRLHIVARLLAQGLVVVLVVVEVVCGVRFVFFFVVVVVCVVFVYFSAGRGLVGLF